MKSEIAVAKYRIENPSFREMWDQLTLSQQILIEGLVDSALHAEWKERWNKDVERVYDALDGR